MDFFGGLSWRFEEFIPFKRRKVDRIGVFRAKTELNLKEDFTFNEQEYSMYACPLHNNLTEAIVSFRIAQALQLNSGSQHNIHDFNWHNTHKLS